MLPTFPRTSLDIEPVASRNPYLNGDDTSIVVALVRSVSPRVVVEIGTSIGLTARCILDRVPCIECYIAVDVPPDHEPTLSGQRKEIPPIAGIEAMSDPRFEVVIRNGGSAGLSKGDLPLCDAVFIDGDHSFKAVFSDSVVMRRFVRPGGVIIWHDYLNPEVEVTDALDYLYDETQWPIQLVERSWVAFLNV